MIGVLDWFGFAWIGLVWLGLVWISLGWCFGFGIEPPVLVEDKWETTVVGCYGCESLNRGAVGHHSEFLSRVAQIEIHSL